jgi:hypothetical protein
MSMNKAKKYQGLALGIFTLAVSIGCAGGGGETIIPSDGRLLPKVTLVWPPLSRNFTAPNFALSAKIVVTPVATPNKSVTWTLDRPDTSDESFVNSKGPELPAVGEVTVTVEFNNKKNAAGIIVATAGIAGSIKTDGTIMLPDGSPLGRIGFTSKIQSLRLGLPGRMYVGESFPLLVYSGDPASEINAIATENVFFKAQLGAENVTIADQKVTAVNDGFCEIEASSGTIRGTGVVQIYRERSSYRVIGRNIVSADTNPADGKLYVILNSSHPTNPNSFAEIDVATGNVRNAVALASEPNLLKFSADGSKAWITFPFDKSLQAVSMSNLSLGPVFKITDPYFDRYSYLIIYRLIVNPLNSNEVMLSLGYSIPGTTGYKQFVFRDGVRVPFETPGTFARQNSAAYTNDNRLLTLQYDRVGTSDVFEPILRSYSITENGFIPLSTSPWRTDGVYDFIPSIGNAFLSSGSIVSVASLTKVGTLPTFATMCYDGVNKKIWLSRSPGAIVCLDSESDKRISSTDFDFYYGTQKMIRYGEKALVLSDGSQLYVYDRAIGL